VERVTNGVASAGYFFAWQRFVDACQSPPAFSQSAWFWIVENEPVVGLAEGDAPEDEPPVDDGEPLDDGAPTDPLPEPVAPVLPVPPVLEPPEVEPAAPLLLPLPAPAPVCAATSAGAKQIIPIKTRVSIFFIPFLLGCGQSGFALPRQEAAITGPSTSRVETRRKDRTERAAAYARGAVVVTSARCSMTRNATTPAIVAAIAAAAKRIGVAGSPVTSRNQPASGCAAAITT